MAQPADVEAALKEVEKAAKKQKVCAASSADAINKMLQVRVCHAATAQCTLVCFFLLANLESQAAIHPAQLPSRPPRLAPCPCPVGPSKGAAASARGRRRQPAPGAGGAAC